VRAFSVGVTPG